MELFAEIWQLLLQEVPQFLNNFNDPNFVTNVFMIVFIICCFLIYKCPCYKQTEEEQRSQEEKERRELARLMAKKARLNERNKEFLKYHLNDLYDDVLTRSYKKNNEELRKMMIYEV